MQVNISFLDADRAGEATEILKLAAAWSTRVGVRMWEPAEFELGSFRGHANAGELAGAAMLEWAWDVAGARGAQALRLDTVPTGVLPALYEKFGFARVDPAPRQFNGKTMLRLERRTLVR